jgi:uracil-DNA glycosylase
LYTKLVDILPELFESLPPSWKVPLAGEKENFERIQQFLNHRDFIPQENNIFNALTIPPEKIRVVIVGQDPYPNPAHAMGLSFSVPNSISPLPASLQNIFKELESDCGISNRNGDLSYWRDQGVLLINRILTTDRGSSLAHIGIGWEQITKRIVGIAAQRQVIAVLWGNKAQELAGLFPHQLVLASAHPSPLSAYRGFFGSKPFSKINSMLVEAGQVPIDWRTY